MSTYNNVALITGASSGIGAEFARLHAKKGGDLVVVSRSNDKLQTLKEELESAYNIQVTCIAKDLSIPGAATEVYKNVQEKNITVTTLINNAGFGGVGAFHERDWSEDAAMINLNIVALAELTHLYISDFLEHKREGRILNVSSTASLMPGPNQAVYFATKAFVTSFSNALYEELRDTDITVTALLPGATATNFGSVSGMDKTALFSNAHSASTVAQAGYTGMEAGKLNVIAGVSFSQRLLLRVLPLVPKRLLLKQIKQLQTTD